MHTPSTPHKPANSYYLPQLDGLRSVSFFLIFIHHFTGGPSNELWKGIHQYGWAGVDLFFTISAFLFTSLLHKEQQLIGHLQAKRFYLRRILRIVPLYYAYILGVCVFYRSDILANHDMWLHVISLLTFTDNIVIAAYGYNPIPSTGHLWTISYEMQLYLIIPWLYLLLARLAYHTRIAVCALIILISLLLREQAMAAGYIHPFIYLLPILRPESILIGVLLGFALQEKKIFNQKILRLITISACGSFLAIITLRQNITIYGFWQYYIYFVVACMWGSIVFAALKSNSLLSSLLQTPPLVYLGKISYGLYIFHLIALNSTPLLLSHFGWADCPWSIHFLLALSFTITAASASYYAFEHPFLKMKTRYAIIPSKPT